MHTHLPAPGEVVWIRDRRWRVRRAVRRRSVVRLDVAARDERLTFLAPFDRPARLSRAGRRRRVRPRSAAARLAHLLARAHGVRTLVAAVRADVAILPHQLEPALAMRHGARRVLIADAVGLGKTVQAGLVIAELTRRLVAPRILVIVPAALDEQWRGELAGRFGVPALIADRARLDDLARQGARGDNPWQRAGTWIASLDFLKQPHVFAALPPRPWDLVVIDEAHAACGESERHAAADAIARRSRQLLLLTATPHDGDAARFARLQNLGAIDDDLTVFRRGRAEIAAAAPRRVRWHGVALSAEETRVLAALAEFERAVVAAAGPSRRDAALLLLAVFRKRAVSTMNALAVSLARRQAWIERPDDVAAADWRQPSLLAGDEDADDDLALDESRSLTGDVGLDPRRERTWLRRLRALADAARRRESKLARMVSLLRRSPEPVTIFTEFRHSLEAVLRRIEPLRPVAILHGGLTPPERSRQLGRFLDGSASVLLATDVASLGLNLQHRTRWVISLELPWNPARLEQRLGRVDRIGQTRPVHLTMLVARHDAEAAVLGRLARRLFVARRALGDDALGGIRPDAASLRESVLLGTPPAEPPAEARTVPLCRRWTRVARVSARALERRRRLNTHWRAPEPDHGRARWATWRRDLGSDGGRVLGPGETLLLFSVPLLDGAGSPLEEHVVAVRIPPDPTGSAMTGVTLDAASDRARRSLGPRAARVGRWLRARYHEDTARDHTLIAAIGAETVPREAQPGLFDRREMRAFEAARRTVTEVIAEAGEPLDDRHRIADAAPGRPVLAFILTRA